MRFALATSVVALAVTAAAAPQPAGQRIGTAIPISKRSSFVNADKTFNAGALEAHVASVEAKILRGFTNFERNTGKVHPLAPKGLEKRGAGVPLTGYNGNFWYGSISVGTPGVSFTVDFDTGSSDLFVPATTCDSTCKNHTLWDPTSSSTAQDLNKTFNIAYGDNSTVSGEQYMDTVSIAGYSATNQTLGAATTYSTGFQSPGFPADGLMGMGFQSISVYPASPVFQTLVSQGQVTPPVFSFKLTTSGGELYIGGSNSALYTGSFTCHAAGHWQVAMDNIQGNNQTILSNLDAIIDTGSNLVFGNSTQVATLYNTLGGKPAPSDVGDGFYTFSCDSFPTISLTFSGTSFPIPASVLNLGPVSDGSSDCISGLAGSTATESVWIIGDLFLQSVYTAFDVGNTRVGFAQLA